MFRVYDKEQDKWVKNNIYMNSNDDLYLIKQSLFGMIKIPLALDIERYICHRDIGLYDKYDVLIFEGDFVKAQVDEDKEVIGLVAYAYELSAYVILCVDSEEFYALGSQVCQYIEVIGNVFDDYKKQV